jgi:diguanylate cyclase (GGDEF)-like protein
VAVKSDGGEITHYVASMVDLTDRKAAEKQIEHLAYYDTLTQLPNRRLFLDRLQQALAGCARSGRKGALLFIGLDNFKILNETAGHDVGDQLLVEVARRIAGCVRNGDTAARLGGDEFVVLLEESNDCIREAAAQAKEIGERILAALNQPYSIAGRLHHSTPSIGVTLFIDAVDSLDELLKQADIAMYQAKSAGRNALRFFDPEMQGALAARTVLESALRLAIRDRQFVLHYQPQVDGAGERHRRRGAAALAPPRARHGFAGRVHPSGRGNRADSADRPVGAGSGLFAAQGLGGRPAHPRVAASPSTSAPASSARPISSTTCVRRWNAPALPPPS